MLGHHFALSSEREKGARYLQAAGDRARMIYANDDALRFYERALAALDWPRNTAQTGNCRAHCRSVRPGRAPRDRAGPLRDGAAGISRNRPIMSPRRGFCARSAGCSGMLASATARNLVMPKRRRCSREQMPRSNRHISGKSGAAWRSAAEITLSPQNGRTRRWIACAL